MIFRALPWPLSVRALIGLITVTASTLYVAYSLDNGWIPHDEGQLGHTAERILSGDLPHRDFIEPYTGGLGYLNAWAFRMAGVRSEVLRWQMLPFFAAFAGCIYFIAGRVLPRTSAAGITFLCTCLSLPIYPAGMPSWYNLFAATYGTAALLRYLDTAKARWLIVAGVCGGLSILVKITGLYFVAAAALWLIFCEQSSCNSDQRRSLAFSLCSTVVLAAFGAVGLLFVRRENPVVDLIHFSIPFAGLAAFVIYHEWRSGRGCFCSRTARLGRLLFPFFIGIVIPLLAFAMPFVWAQATGDLLRGLFVLPARRLVGARMALPDVQWLAFALPLACLFAAGMARQCLFSKRPFRIMCVAIIALGLAVSHTSAGFFAFFQALRHQLPLLVLLALAMLWRAGEQSLSIARRQELLLLSAATFFVSLIQFPYSGGFYFFYAAPLGVLLASYLIAFQPHAPRRIHSAVLVFVVAFLLLRMHEPNPAITGGPYAPETKASRLEFPRCQFLVRHDQAVLYTDLIRSVQSHSAAGDFIYAAPDCPEVYFLAGRQNPTRSLYEFFDQPHASACDRLLADLDRLHVKVIVLQQYSEFSHKLDTELVATLTQRFPNRQEFVAKNGHNSRTAFVLLWRS